MGYRMDIQERTERSARVVEKFGYLEGLLANPDFRRWADEGPLRDLQALRDSILDIRQDAGWKEAAADRIVAYQALKASYDRHVGGYEQALKVARENLRASKTGPE